jgi:hypothetical protein
VVLGSVYLEAGVHEDVEVPLSRSRVLAYGYGAATRPLALMLVRDDGDRKLSGRNGPDTPFLRGAEPLVVRVGFREGDALDANDQTLADGELTVAYVDARQPSFVVVHALDDQGNVVGDPPLGVAPVDAGRSRYVHVPLDPGLLQRYGYGTEARGVSVMLHVNDGDGAYSFPGGRDVPVPGDGGPLAQQVALSLPGPDRPAVATDVPIRLEVGADGISLVLRGVTNGQPAFIVLHQVDADGNVIESGIVARTAALGPRTRNRLTIRIRGDIIPLVGDTLAVMMYADDGDRAFRYPTSDPPLKVDGVPFVYRFTVQ